MITLVYPVHPRKGYRLDLACPAVLCDSCGALIDADQPGLIVWRPSDDRAAWHVHTDACVYAIEKRAGERLLSRELGDWLTQLSYNHQDPLTGAQVDVGAYGEVFTVGEVRTQADDQGLSRRAQ